MKYEKIKMIAVGNTLMGDDGVGIVVANAIKDKFISSQIEFIIGETDSEYCIDNINKDDFLIILDSVYSSETPGTLKIFPLEKAKYYSNFCSQHELNLIKLLDIYNMNNKGIVIGIEVSSIRLYSSISPKLKKYIPTICNKTIDIVNSIINL
jgi:hydrogenase maturation protease